MDVLKFELSPEQFGKIRLVNVTINSTICLYSPTDEMHYLRKQILDIK